VPRTDTRTESLFAVRTMYVAYWFVIIAGLAVYFVVGLTVE
jgi:hypothetical protein